VVLAVTEAPDASILPLDMNWSDDDDDLALLWMIDRGLDDA